MGGPRGAAAAITAALSFDFFHTRPYLSLSIVSRDDVETAALLLVAGLIVGTMAGRSGRARQSAAASSSEIRRIHRLAELVAAGENATDVILACQAELTALLALGPVTSRLRRSTCPCPAWSGPEASPAPAPAGTWKAASTSRRKASSSRCSAGASESARFVLDPTPEVGVSLEQQVVAVALADQVGAALARRPRQPPVRGHHMKGLQCST